MLAAMLESMLPPGVTMEKITETAQQLAAQMVETAQTIKRVETLLLEVKQMLVEAQGATLLPLLKESNHDDQQRPADAASGLSGAPAGDSSNYPCPGCGTRIPGPCQSGTGNKCAGYNPADYAGI